MMTAKEMFVWVIAIACIALVLLSPAACTINKHRMIAEVVKSGVDPIKARCAIDGGDTAIQQAQCAALVQPKQ